VKRKIEEDLLAWKNKPSRKPLILFGARQVGKTFILNEFGKTFKNCVYINFETTLSVAEYFNKDIAPRKLVRFLETTARATIVPGETLIIFDEAQACERSLTALKYFCEDAPEYHIAAAGRLLGLAVNRERYSFPVGKVESHTLYPMDFEEFLWALGETRLAEDIRAAYQTLSPLPQNLHDRATELYRCYLLVGGMPSCVAAFAAANSLVMIPNLQNEIINNYAADMAKYASHSDSVKIRACFNSIPAQLAKENKKFQYKVVQRGGSAAIFGTAIDWLTQSGVAMKAERLEHAVHPVAVYADLSSFKLYMSDVGLLSLKSGIAQQLVLTGDSNLFMGALTENYIAQVFAAKNYPLYYWTSGYSAELDFVLQNETQITGVEVKKGIKTHSKSLSVFLQAYPRARAIRFSEKNFGVMGQGICLPHYAAFCV
jgi:predicted AAA+ superfamily ATPase